MAVSISTLSILLTGSAAGLVNAFHEGEHGGEEFGESMKGLGETVGEIGAVFGLALGAEAVVDSFKERAQAIGDISLKARELGESAQSFTELNFAAHETGVATDALATSMAKMENNIEKAVQGSKQQAEAFERLGINAGELAKLSPDEQFKKIADAIAQLQSPQERINAEMAIFGKTGAQLGPLLQQGSAGINDMAKEADKLGVTLNDVDAAKVLEANNSLAQMGDVIEGVQNQIIVDLAPVITDVSARFKHWLEDGNVIQRGLGVAFSAMGEGAAFVADSIKLGEGAYDAFGSGVLFVTGGILKAFDKLYEGFAFVSNKIFHTHFDTSQFDAATNSILDDAKKLGAQAGQEFSAAFNGTAGAQAKQWFDQLQSDANSRAASTLAQQGTGKESPLDEHAKKSEGLFEKLGKLGESAWKKIEGAIDSAAKKAEEQNKRLDDQAKSLLGEFATPLEKERQKIAEVQSLYASGHLTGQQRDTLDQRIKLEFEKDVNFTPKAAVAGSQDAFNLINQIDSRVRKNGGGVGERQLTESQKQTNLLKNLVDKTKPVTVMLGASL